MPAGRHGGKLKQRPYLAHEPANKGCGCHCCPRPRLVVCDDEVIPRSLQADAIKVYTLWFHVLDFGPLFAPMST